MIYVRKQIKEAMLAQASVLSNPLYMGDPLDPDPDPTQGVSGVGHQGTPPRAPQDASAGGEAGRPRAQSNEAMLAQASVLSNPLYMADPLEPDPDPTQGGNAMNMPTPPAIPVQSAPQQNQSHGDSFRSNAPLPNRVAQHFHRCLRRQAVATRAAKRRPSAKPGSLSNTRPNKINQIRAPFAQIGPLRPAKPGPSPKPRVTRGGEPARRAWPRPATRLLE